MKTYLFLAMCLFCSNTIIGQLTYTEISLDTLEHFSIEMTPGATYYFQTLSGSKGSFKSAGILFVDSNNNALDFINIEIDDILLAATGSTVFVWSIRFNISLAENAPPPGLIDDLSLVSIFFNANQDVIGGFVRSNMSISIKGPVTTLNNPSKDNLIKVFPNPTNGMIWLEDVSKKPLENIAVYDMIGRLIKEDVQIRSSQHSLDLRHLPSGSYLIRQLRQDQPPRVFTVYVR